ncbi:hypothetical protein ACQP1W_09295 [Spirillospora sp. CA-255316]
MRPSRARQRTDPRHAQIALAHMARTLTSKFGVDVEVVAIPRESA